MEFRKYNEIDNVERQKTTDSIIYCGMSGGKWVVGEKCHGANCSFWMRMEGDETEFRVAKRSGFIKNFDSNSFFGFDSIERDEYMAKTSKLFELCQEKYGDVELITVYGEWCGGLYPHPDVPRVEAAIRVQKGIWYAPTNEFLVFDLKVNGQYVTVDDYEELCPDAGFNVLKSIFRGTFAECVAYPNERESKVHELFGLPAIPGNICEGNVIKPVDARFFPTGDRVILKNKNEKHREKSERKPKIKELLKPFNTKQDKLFAELVALLCENRLRNVLSHIGPVSDKMFGKVQGLFLQDALDELKKDNAEDIAELSKDEFKAVAKRGQIESATMVRKNFSDILDQNF